MRILRIIYDFPPPWNGLAPFPFELSKAQAKLGDKVHVICGLWPNQKPKIRNLPEGLQLHRIFREPFKGALMIVTAPIAFLYIAILRLAVNFDYIHGHGHFPFYFHLYKTIFGSLDKIPYVFHLHITAAGRKRKAKEMGDTLDFGSKYIEWPLHELSDKLGCRIAEKIFVTGNDVRKEAIKYYNADPEKIVILENGVNTEHFKPEGGNKRKDLGFKNDDKVLLFVGAHTDRKNLHTLILALSKLPPNYKLVTIGTGPTEYLGFLEKEAKELDLNGRINFLGFVPYPTLPEYYRTADMLVLPSSYEGFPKVVLEALSSGLKVIASGFKPQEEIQGLNLLNKINEEKLKEEILKSANSSDEPSRNQITKRYSWENVAKKIEQEIKPLLS